MTMGRTLILIGVLFVLAGLVVSVLPKLPGIGRLPGDIFIRKDHFTFYFPITTCLLLSMLLTVFLWLMGRR